MFSSSKNSGKTPQGGAKTPNNFNYLVEGSSFEGKVKSKSDFRIDGYFSGTLNCSSKVVIGTDGNFEGEIVCENAVIEGKFSGIIKVSSLLIVKDKATIIGDVTTEKLMVQEGAHFHVTCAMGGQNGSGGTSFVKSDDQKKQQSGNDGKGK